MKRILVVDDDRNITELTQLVLESAGYMCKTVNSGNDCIRILSGAQDDKDAQFDLVLLDVAMPGFSGIDVINKIKQDQLFPANHIVFFTASSSSMLDSKQLKAMGVRDIFKKPFKKAELLKAIDDYLAS